MMHLKGKAATAAEFNLAEGVLWDDRAGLVRWVDVWEGRVLSGALHNGRITDILEVSLGQTAGAVALAEDGGLVVAAARGLATVSPTGDVSRGPDLLGQRTDVRFNDGTVDPHGAFVVGTLSLTDRTDEEQLLRIWPDGRIETLREGIGLSNGVAFSPDGSTIYHVDTLAGTVSRHSYGPTPLDPDESWTTVLDSLPAYPDGLTVDAEGALWVAQWGGASVERHAPTGELLAVVKVNAAQASCPGFVGSNLNILAITTAQEGLDTFTDEAGAIFLADVGVSGLSPHLWAGSTTNPYWRKEDT
ncbi:SMP-30/gluconolactonase/LRE family protein [Paenarthrobacter sp. TE4293]|uniref:SMP-30/gluconolactonase/LRE family protein n=1 Tax=Paenarthrobacter sp. TE4293 TaxID=3381695 RepID=UPI003D1E4DAE